MIQCVEVRLDQEALRKEGFDADVQAENEVRLALLRPLASVLHASGVTGYRPTHRCHPTPTRARATRSALPHATATPPHHPVWLADALHDFDTPPMSIWPVSRMPDSKNRKGFLCRQVEAAWVAHCHSNDEQSAHSLRGSAQRVTAAFPSVSRHAGTDQQTLRYATTRPAHARHLYTADVQHAIDREGERQPNRKTSRGR
jgi:hypothetical protein